MTLAYSSHRARKIVKIDPEGKTSQEMHDELISRLPEHLLEEWNHFEQFGWSSEQIASRLGIRYTDISKKKREEAKIKKIKDVEHLHQLGANVFTIAAATDSAPSHVNRIIKSMKSRQKSV